MTNIKITFKMKAVEIVRVVEDILNVFTLQCVKSLINKVWLVRDFVHGEYTLQKRYSIVLCTFIKAYTQYL